MYSFKAKIASRGYHVFKETSWSNAKEGDEVKVDLETNKSSKKIDPYACAVRAKEEYFKGWKTVGHIPREISRHVYFFIKSEGGSVSGTVISTKYRTSPIPAGGLEIPLLLTFSCSKAISFEKMKTFVQTLYDYKFTGTVVIEEENSDDEDEVIVINESDSQTVNNCTQLVCYSDSENEDEKQDRSEESNSEYEGEKQDGSEESNSEYENENQDGSEESNSEDENENQGSNNIPILNDENEIEIVLITE